MVKLSIIIPVYNAERFLRECLDSISMQSFRDCEVLMVDDGSSDDSAEICREYAMRDDRFSLICQTNAGPGAARNRGLDAAQGQFIQFVDADDFLEPHCCEKAIAAMTDADIVFFGNTTIHADGGTEKLTPSQAYCATREATEEELLVLKGENSSHYPFFGFTWNKIFCREIIVANKVRFHEDLRAFEDEVFTGEYMRGVVRMRVLDDALYCYRVGHVSLTRRLHPPEVYARVCQLSDAVVGQYSNEKTVILEKRTTLFRLLLAAYLEPATNASLCRVRAAEIFFDKNKIWLKSVKYRLFFMPMRPLGNVLFLLCRWKFRKRNRV